MKIHAIGPKPQKDRSLTQILKNGALAVAFAGAALSSAALASPLLKTPSGSALSQQQVVMLNGLSAKQIDLLKPTQDGLPQIADNWLKAGFTPEEADLLLRELIIGQSPVLCQDSGCQKVFSAMSLKTKKIWEINSLEDLESAPIVPLEVGEILGGVSVPLSTEVETREELVSKWQDLNIYRSNQDWSSQPTSHDLESLKKVVQETGLNYLVLPLPMYNQKNIQTLATDLKSANQDLQQITGEKGGVLGLYGSAGLYPMISTQADSVATTSFSKEMGKIIIQSDISLLGHEWFHAFDFFSTIREKNLQAQSPISKGFSRYHHNVNDFSWQGLPEDLIQASKDSGGQWGSRIEKAKDWYFSDPSEQAAFAFSTYVVLARPNSVMNLSMAKKEYGEGFQIKHPTNQEALSQKKVFQGLFAQTPWDNVQEAAKPENVRKKIEEIRAQQLQKKQNALPKIK